MYSINASPYSTSSRVASPSVSVSGFEQTGKRGSSLISSIKQQSLRQAICIALASSKPVQVLPVNFQSAGPVEQLKFVPFANSEVLGFQLLLGPISRNVG